MSNSTLSYISSSSFRDSLMAKNLAPYNVVGVYSPAVGNLTYETVLGVSNVIDSPGELIANDPFANKLYPLNEYGPTGGYDTAITYNGAPLPVNSNQGEYMPTDTVLDLVNEFFIDAAYLENYYGPVGGFNNMVTITTNKPFGNPIHQPYGSTFVPSTYSPYSILLSSNPSGLSNDSYLAKLGAQELRNLFQDRIARQIFINTVGQVNLDALQDPFEASLLVTGQQPLIYKNWKITSPENPIAAAADLITRLGGAYWPVSLIPGDYFTDNTRNGQTQQTSNALNVVNQLTGGFLGPILNKNRNPSEIFLVNTGNGQRSALFNNINYNRYQPPYDKSYGGLLGIGQAIVNLAVDLINGDNGTLVGGYYVGSRNAEPSTIASPPNQVPVNAFGQQVQAPVYGPSELGILFEGNSSTLNFGLAGKSISDGGGIDGQFVWTSPKYKPNAGFKATPGGGSGSADPQFNSISSNYTRDESTNITFKETSILDETQRLINSADNVTGVNRLKHVGNAINQVSKVFHDGYKEITKGSQVVSYTDQTTGGEAGIEYCRVFTKDTPYYTYADLQKTDGITTKGRQFPSSVLDNTFNLNIAPMRNPGSTNIVPDVDGKGGYAKKYMFSIENLAWRTSHRPGFTYDELPVCEKGPNGGRVMWFPPYELKFTDSSTANWNQTSFLGRPEPMYTYKDTKRSGTLSWKIIVDHPSVMNTLVEKQLKGQNKERINSIMDSFFAGCVKYDIYALAMKFNMIPAKDLYTYQQILQNPKSTPEEIKGVAANLNTEASTNTATVSSSTPQTNTTNVDLDSKYNNFAFYFDNNIPGPTNKTNPIPNSTYKADYDNYTYGMNQDQYVAISSKTFNSGNPNLNVKEFFNNVVIDNFNYINTDFIEDAFKILSEKTGTIKVSLRAAASAPATKPYNKTLSERRANSVIEYFKTTKLGKFITEDNTFVFGSVDTLGESDTAIPKSSKNGFGSSVNCTKDIISKNGKSTDDSQWYSVDAMACRRVVITDITVTPIAPEPPIVPEPPKVVPGTTGTTITIPKPVPVFETRKELKKGISKLVIRQMLSECDYFEAIKEDSPMLYDSIQDKIKYFNPAFHSMTPEGLNSRLTFLNQCVRPGETIPIIGTDGKSRYNDAINTSFGAPPVLVLRIGDFFNTKIIPNTVSFSYDPISLDLNPEGIGVQPMIATVTLGFDIIGGMGLKKPVEELQNALSFNFYANTEIYDERATATEDTSKLDAQVLQSILDSQPVVNVNNVDTQQTNDAGTTIGQIITNIPVEGGQNGDITYKSIMDKLLDSTKEYYTNVVNQAESVAKSYNDGVWQLMCNDRNYVNGAFDIENGGKWDVKVFGKSSFQSSLDSLFTTTIGDIDSGNNFIIVGLNALSFNNESVISKVKKNLVNYLTTYKIDFSNGVSEFNNKIVNQEQDMVQIFRKISLVVSKTDGLIIDSKTPRVYNLSGTSEVTKSSEPITTNTYDELSRDFQSVGTKLNEYDKKLVDDGIIINTYGEPGSFSPATSGLSELTDKRFFMIMAQIFSDKNKLEKFKTEIISGDLVGVKTPANLKKKFDKIVDNFRDKVVDELKAELKKFKKTKESQAYLDYINKPAFTKGKTRKFNYTTIPNTSTNDQQSAAIQLLYKGNNNGDKNIWTDKTQFN